MSVRLVEHDPQAIEPRGFDWTAWLLELGPTVTISASTWAVTGPDSALTLSGSSIVVGSLKTQIILTAGTLGAQYTVTNHVTTTTAVEDDRSFDVLVIQR